MARGRSGIAIAQPESKIIAAAAGGNARPSLVSAILVSIFCYFSDLHTNIFARFRKILHMASLLFLLFLL
ncbi:MAG TPA: hypothetical protein VNX60_12960, partial [Candidatus Acidoferrum sp.]|nr:hypothetical protein [Candidatus Acidoferrum sp.]